MTEKYAFGSGMYDATRIAPDSDRKVLCLTVTKKGLANFVLGYWDGERWVCGMNSNVVAWVDLPDPGELMKKLTEEAGE